MISAETKGGDTRLLWLSGNDLLLNYTTSFMQALSSSTYYGPHEKNPLDSKSDKAPATGRSWRWVSVTESCWGLYPNISFNSALPPQLPLFPQVLKGYFQRFFCFYVALSL